MTIKTSYLFPFLGIFALSALFFTILPQSRYVADKNIIERWQPTSAFQFPRRAPAAVTKNNVIYIIGGVDELGNYVTTVEYSKIKPDGTLAAWQNTSPLQHGRFYLSATVFADYIYAIGGGAGPLGEGNYPVTAVERAHIQADGSLSAWESVTPLETPRRGLKSVADQNGRIYAIGGYNGTFLRSIEHARITVSGSLPSWSTDPQQSILDRYIHSAALYENYLYVLGGHVQKQNTMSYGDVEMSHIKADGFLAPWQIEKSRLQQPRFIASAFAAGEHLYMVGGHNGAQRLDSVEFAPIFASGHIGRWRFTAALNQPRSATAVVHAEKFVYVLGGMSNDTVLNSVEFSMIQPNGQLGFKRSHN